MAQDRLYVAAAVVAGATLAYLAAVPTTSRQHLYVAMVVATTAATAWAFLHRQRLYTEYFAQPYKTCPTSCTPEPQTDGTREVNLDDLANMPLRPCEMYFTENLVDCDSGWYTKSKLELMDLRAKYEADPDKYGEELTRVNRVLADYDLVSTRQCKVSFNNWKRPDHPSFPILRINRAELDARGNARHWAYCFAPIPNTAADDALKAIVAKNTAANGPTVVLTEGDTYALSTGPNRRVEFASMERRDVVNAFCATFTPSQIPAILPAYQVMAATPNLYAIDMTNDGIIKGLVLARWDDGYIRDVPLTATVAVDSFQDDVSNRPAYLDMPQTPLRFSIESAYHCSPPNLRQQQSVYVEELKKLFFFNVTDRGLVYEFNPEARIRVFNINICSRVDKIETKDTTDIGIGLNAFFGDVVPEAAVLMASPKKYLDEHKDAKAAAHEAICTLAGQMTTTYAAIQEVQDKQRVLSNTYLGYTQPDSGARVTMTPYTAQTDPQFAELRNKERDLQAIFDRMAADKAAHVATINRVNSDIALIEERMRNLMGTIMTNMKGKKIAVPDKPYVYITNDGRTYFQQKI